MSHYIERECAKHGEWSMDVDNVQELCPKCEESLTGPAPLSLAITPQEWIWLRREYVDAVRPRAWPIPGKAALKLAIDFLLRVEAGRQRIMFEDVHRPHDVTRECLGCWATNDPRHDWTPAEWLAHVRREKLGE